MTRTLRYAKAASIEAAQALKSSDPSAVYLAGGTFLLAGDARDKPESVIDVGAALPRGVDRVGGSIVIGAGTTFQELAESKDTPVCLAEAALSMANRNTRNRASVGGNLGADKSCSSLIPILVVLGAEVELASPASAAPRRIELESWLQSRDAAEGATPQELVLRILLPPPGHGAAYRRWNRASCDLSVLGAAASLRLESGVVRDLRLVIGGMGPRARRFPSLEALFEGRPLPSRESIESSAASLFAPRGDLRASAAFKRMRCSQLVAEAMLEASE